MPDRTGTASAEERDSNKPDPGACRHGNFINYYQFHPAKERVAQLPRGVWHAAAPFPNRKYIGLDIGCNAGDLTSVLYDFLEENLSTCDITGISLLGVDLDPILIQRAQECNSRPNQITYRCLDFMSVQQNAVLNDYLVKEDRNRFDVAFCFSITMWIHLNHGDSGLVKFLQSVCEKTDMIVIEPQLWKCYRNASRRLRRANAGDFPLLDSLRYSGDMEVHIETILTDHCGFKKIAESGNNDWGRKLLIYRRNICIQ